jgi:nucleotide-binding universal stress UspA family protein
MDYSELAEEALRTVLSLHPDAEITVLHVIDFRTSDLGPGGWGDAPDEFDVWLEEAREHADGLLGDAEAIAAEYDVDVGTETVVGEDASSILSYVEDHDVDLVVVGTHGRRGLDRYVLGSVAERLVRTSPVPVLTVRGPADGA